jgi:hypothetical protein
MRVEDNQFESRKNHVRQIHYGGGQVNSPIRYSVTLGAATLAIVMATGAAFVVWAHHGSGNHGSPQVAEICATTGSEDTAEAPFLAENDAAMKKMMADMAVKPTGDVDADFVAMMVPHHQGAIDMAIAVLRHGRNAQIRRLAQEIIVTQQQEIAAMRLAVGQPLPPSVPSPSKAPPAGQIDSKSNGLSDEVKEP